MKNVRIQSLIYVRNLYAVGVNSKIFMEVLLYVA